MLKKNIKAIFEKNKSHGWMPEPDAKSVINQSGLDIPDFCLTNSIGEAKTFFKEAGNSVAVKAVSRKIIHKTEHNAVVAGVSSQKQLEEEMTRLKKIDGCENILVEEMIQGVELMAGAKNDFQFGPVIIFGIGGTSVEIYNDTAIRMAPLSPGDVQSMVDSLEAKEIIKGYRGKPGVNTEALTKMLVDFSGLVMEFEHEIESVDLNPVICTEQRCVSADARIILKSLKQKDTEREDK